MNYFLVSPIFVQASTFSIMFGFFEYQYLKFKKNHLKNLAALAAIDGHIHEAEVAYLYKIGEKYLLKPNQIKRILESQENTQPEIPSEDPQKVAMLYDLVGMMMADDVVDEAEMTFCRDMFRKLGYKESLIKEMMKKNKEGVEDADAWEAFLEETQSFKLNLAKW